MEISDPAPVTVLVVDYEITLASGKELSYSLRPDLGDREDNAEPRPWAGGYGVPEPKALRIHQSKRDITIYHSQIAVITRSERQMALMPLKLGPNNVKASNGR